MEFNSRLINWYENNKRDLPWRNTRNPYPIWLSEIMLQQTRVAQGLPYFNAFINEFPTVFDLANAKEEQVLKLWQGLGYYSRARNLHKTAQQIAFENNGIFPDNYKELLKLKGVGSYTAAAIASFANNEKVAVVDGNVFRVLARYFNIDTDIAQENSKKEFSDLAFELMQNCDPALFNQAIMEFGALQCVPKNPNCSDCIFNQSCGALQKKKVDILPIKSKKTKVKNRYLNYIVFIDQNQNTQINKRTEKGIWHNLYEFPLIETEKTATENFIKKQLETEYEIFTCSEFSENEIIHKLTHQKLHIKFWKVEIKSQLVDGISVQEIVKYPFPIVIFNFIEKELLSV